MILKKNANGLLFFKFENHLQHIPVMSEPYEPLFDDANDRIMLYPIKFPHIWDAYKKHVDVVWYPHEIDLSEDASDWKKLNPDEQYFIKRVLAFFASSDIIVARNLTERFGSDVKINEAKIFYNWQTTMENIHTETYSNLLDVYVTDIYERTMLFDAATKIPCIKAKADWAMRWIESQSNFAKRLVAFAAVEGIFFSGSFCAIYWIAQKRILKGLCKSNDFIARDEALHVDFACLLYSMIGAKLTQEEMQEIIVEAVNLEIEFITDALPCKLLGMNSEQMIEYIKFVANRLAVQLGYRVIYENVTQPFAFMPNIALDEKTNFFENRVHSYTSNASESTRDSINDAFATIVRAPREI